MAQPARARGSGLLFFGRKLEIGRGIIPLRSGRMLAGAILALVAAFLVLVPPGEEVRAGELHPVSPQGTQEATALPRSVGVKETPAVISWDSSRLIVRYRPGVTAAVKGRLRAALAPGTRVVKSYPRWGWEVLELAPGGDARALAAAFRRRPEVVWAEPDQIRRITLYPADPHFPRLWGLHNTGQKVNGVTGTSDADIDAPEAWDLSTGSEEVIVGVVDTGVAYDHPDLAPNIWVNPGETGEGRETNGLDDDGNGLVDDWRGWDFAGSDNDPWDDHGHGTHVAGTIGAKGSDAYGVAGVSWQVRIIPLKVCGADGLCWLSDVLAGYLYAVEKGARVINVSLACGPDPNCYSEMERDVIAGVPETLFVVAAGNDSVNNDQPGKPSYPCNYPEPNIICVAATDQNDALASFSNWGPTSVDLGAPGVNILSAQPGYGFPVYAEGFETDLAGRWVTGGTTAWARTGAEAFTGSFSVTDSPGGNYAPGTDAWIARQNPMDLTGRTGCRVEYNLWLDTEYTSPTVYDALFIEASTDGSNWSWVAGWAGKSGGWVRMSKDFSAYDGQPAVWLRFRLWANNNQKVGDGAYVDDVEIRCSGSRAYTGSEYAFFHGTSMATPHVAGAAALAFAAHPLATMADVRAALLGGVDPLPSLAGKTVTGGRLNLYRALRLVTAPALTTPADGSAVGRAVYVAGTAPPGSRVTLRFVDGAGSIVQRSVYAGPDGAFATTVGIGRLEPGGVSLQAAVRVGSGWSAVVSRSLSYGGPGLPAPVITAPSEGSVVSGPITVTGTAEPGLRISVRLRDQNGAFTWAMTAAGAGGAWSAVVDSTPLAAGPLVLEVVGRDLASGSWTLITSRSLFK